MAKELKYSELILNDDGSIYHLHLKPENIADKIILVGDPGRVKKLSSLFDSIEFKIENREFVTHTGIYKGERITALSTGIGTDNIDIVLNELDAIVNIDLKKRQKKENHRSLELIRVGTTGGLQAELGVGSFVLSRVAGGLDGLMHFYQDGFSICDQEMEEMFIKHTHWQGKRPVPYFVWSSDYLFDKLNDGVFSGISLSCPGFYAPQGRVLRLPATDPELNDKIHAFNYKNLKITNYEMESSALFGLGKLLGHKATCICVVIANRVTGEFIRDYNPVMQDLLQFTLDHITSKSK